MNRRISFSKVCKFALPLTLGTFIACSDDNSVAGGTETTNSNPIADRDTVLVKDTIYFKDTLLVKDTIVQTKDSIVYVKDTSKTEKDTVFFKDTVFVKDTMPVQNATINGVLQKGPFVNGSSVYAFELDGESMVQTGKIFRGYTDKKGNFKIDNVNFNSKFAILEGTGYFINEVTGMESESQITMSAIADISERETVNINFLTQLEFRRVSYLVANKGMELSEAKAQAKKEIVKTFFGIEKDVNFEDLDIFGTSDEDAMLLAISVLVLANNTDGKFSKTMADFAEDIETDGTFNDMETRIGIADRAAFFLNTAQIRKNMNKLGYAEIPDFEKHIYNYWVGEYGLGKCSSENKDEIKKNQNEISGYRTTRFQCDGERWKPYYFNEDCDYGTLVDERDGKTYKTTKIGDQIWMAENLRYNSEKGYHCYDENEIYCEKYGYYYTFEQVSCPKGWHLPDTTEWTTLFNTVGGADIASKMLRSRGGWDLNINTDIVEDKDEFCFSGLPSGVYPYGAEGVHGYFYTSTTIIREGVVAGAWNRALCGTDGIRVGNMYVTGSTTIRCIKDEE